MPTMKIWGMLSVDNEKSGFDLVLDANWYVMLLDKDEVVARFDPRDYTSIELQTEVERLIQTRCGDLTMGQKKARNQGLAKQ